MVAGLLNGLGLMALIAALFGLMIRARVGAASRDIALGAVFGLFAGLPGIMPDTSGFDPQVMLIGFATAFLGLGGAASAVVFAFILLAAPEGAMVASQAASLLAAACAGLCWSILVPPAWQERPLGHAVLGLMVSGGASLAIWHGPVPAGAVPVGTLAGAAMLGILLALALGAMVVRERSQLRREAALASEARTDPLTGLPNRRALTERHAALAQHWPSPGVAVFVLDLDRFKAVNDTHGHDAGDAVLVTAARRLGDVCADPGWTGRAWLARLGGEEFAVLVAATARHEALELAEVLRRSLAAAPVALPSGEALAVTTSIGVVWSDLPNTLTAMLEAADIALYDAKRAGRNCVRLAGAGIAATPTAGAAPAAIRAVPAAA